ncbi:TetR/AcrR family transcriptional regulator [Streptomyces sp. P1-3]|uniref:TetR/AcrR family transcriptional regulator n=1 Tax=Streptomyces sp. P1-3 TaxID=3421658 RepID=UPI003D36CB1E
MAVARTPRHKWIDEGLRALAAGGPDAVQIEALAKALGVSKGGFYGYFSDRRALLEEMLDRWEREVTDDVEARVEKEGGDAKARLRHLFAIAETGDGLDTDITTELAIRDWARRDPAVAERLRRVDNRHMDYLRSLFRAFCADEDEVEARCLITFSLHIADRFVLADHGDRSRADVHELTTRWLLDSPH